MFKGFIVVAGMGRILLFVVVILTGTIAAPAGAQVGSSLRLPEETEQPEPQRPGSRYLTGPGMNTPGAQAAARAFWKAKVDGRIPRRSKAGHRPSDVGDTLRFNTKRFLGLGWERRHFTLMFEGDGFYLWVETAERDNGHVQDADINALVEALSARTPPGSVNPEAGILENNTTLFGDVPNYDGDGILDILWFDIADDYPSSPPLAGYFAPEDYDPDAPPGQGNQADVLYLDTDPLLIGDDFGIEEVRQVAVQVHQQLIHFNQDPDEHPFVVRGLAEWAKLLNGYDACDGFYLQFPSEHNIAFLSWNPVEPFLGDVQRAALFTTYLAEQLGRDAAVSLVREPTTGADGYRAVLQAQGAPRTLEDLVLDFHTANYVNDPVLDPRFGYTTPACQDVQASPTGFLDASMDTTLVPTSLELRAGGVQYFLWENVRNLRVNLSVDDPTAQGRVRLRAILEGLDGALSFVDLEPPVGGVEGRYKRITVLVFYAQLDETTSRAPVTVSATWDGTAVFTENVVYDDGQVAEEQPNFVRLDGGAIQAVRFEVPERARLARVFLAPYFENQFLGGDGLPLGSPSDPRDFILHVWGDDGMGRPGAERFSLERNDPRLFARASRTLNHFAMDLSAFPELSALPDVVYVGLSNAGADDNHLVFALAPFEGDNPAFLFANVDGSSRWHPLPALTFEGQSLENRVIPIRAQFIADETRTGAEEDTPAGPPTSIVLHPNYPNPFNPSTTIRYSLPHTTPVRLTVYDLLGRVVAVLVDALQPAGEHLVSLDASTWASGTYFYTIESADQRLTRAMLLIK